MKTIKIPETNFEAIICDNLNDILKKALQYPPVSYNKQNIEKAIGKVILPGVINLNTWQTIASYWKRYNIILSYAFFDPYENYIFINLPSLGINVSTSCKLYTQPNTSVLQFLSKILAHEIIHYVFQNNLISVFSYIRTVLINWFTAFYKEVVHDNFLHTLADAHFSLTLDANINMVDKEMAVITKKNLERFVNILDKIKNSIYVKDIELLDEIIQLMLNVLQGKSIQISPKLQTRFKHAYIAIYDGYNLDLQFGQELVYASEILARSTDLNTAKARETTRRLLKAFKP